MSQKQNAKDSKHKIDKTNANNANTIVPVWTRKVSLVSCTKDSLAELLSSLTGAST